MKQHTYDNRDTDHKSHMLSGGRYPVLRTIAILYMIGAIGVALFGLFLAGWCAFGPPAPWVPLFYTTAWSSRLMACISMLGATFIGVISMLAIAEGIKLFIDGANSLRIVASRGITGAAAPAREVVVSSEAGGTAVTM